MPDGVYQWKPVLHRDDVVTTLAAWKTALRAGEPYQCEHRVQLARGDYHWHLSRAVPMRDNDGNIIKWYGTATDIDRFKRADERVLESERRLSAILEQLPVGVGLLDKAGQFVLNNSIFKDLFPFGIMPSRDPPRQGRFSAFAADGRRLAPEQWPGERALRGEIVNPGIEFLYIDDEKKEHWILASAVPFSSADNEVEGAIVVTHDISDRKLAEEKLRNLNQTLEQLVDERTEIARIRTNQLQALTVELIEAEEAERRRIAQLLHDDLQQMLVAAKLHLELCAGDPARDSALENVGQMLRAAITKTRHLSHELSPLVLDHDSLFNGLRWLVGVMKEQFGLEVTLNTHAAQDMGNEVMALFIHRAVQELLFNVVKHAGTKKALVSLASTREGLAVDVIDHGTGFDPDRIDSGACGSIGLGLRSLRERASYLGGSLTIQSAPQQGASFSLTVPIKQKEVSERRRPVFDQRRNAPEAVAKPARMDKLRVLFVDDHSLMRQGLLKVVAGNPAIEVVGEAANGREAIRQARKIKPDVIVMDIAMPEMNGIEATYLIKQEFPEMRIIGLSMSEEDDRAKQMQRAGAEVLISKSALAKDLLNAIYGIASKPEIS